MINALVVIGRRK